MKVEKIGLADFNTYNKSVLNRLLNLQNVCKQIRLQLTPLAQAIPIKAIPATPTHGKIENVLDAANALSNEQGSGLIDRMRESLVTNKEARSYSVELTNFGILCQRAVGSFITLLSRYVKEFLPNGQTQNRQLRLFAQYVERLGLAEEVKNVNRLMAKWYILDLGEALGEQGKNKIMKDTQNMQIVVREDVKLVSYMARIEIQQQLLSHMGRTLSKAAQATPVNSKSTQFKTVFDALAALVAHTRTLARRRAIDRLMSANDITEMLAAQNILSKFIQSDAARKRYSIQFYNFLKIAQGFEFLKLNKQSLIGAQTLIAKALISHIREQQAKVLFAQQVSQDLLNKKGKFAKNQSGARLYNDPMFAPVLLHVRKAFYNLIGRPALLDKLAKSLESLDTDSFKSQKDRVDQYLVLVREYLSQLLTSYRAKRGGSLSRIYMEYLRALQKSGIVGKQVNTRAAMPEPISIEV